MKIRRLSSEEKIGILAIHRSSAIETINARKNKINQIAVDWVCEGNQIRNTWFALYTQFGKSFINKLLFEEYSKRVFYTPVILAVYPEIRVKNDADLLNPKNVTNVVVNSAQKVTDHVDLLLVDELQYVLNPETIRSGVLDMPHTYLCGNAAFLEKDQIKILESKNVKHCFEVTEEDGLELGLLPAFISINIPVSLTNKEKVQYFHIQKQYKECIDFIYPVYEEKAQAAMFSLLGSKSMREECVLKLNNLGTIKITEKQLYGKILLYLRLVKSRMSLLKNLEDKYETTKLLVERHKGEKGIIFVDSIKSAEKMNTYLANSVVYVGKTKEKPLIDFREGKYDQIIVVGKANVGYISAELSYSVNLSFESKALKGKQRGGRIKTVDKNALDREVVNYYLYAPDFTVFKEDQQSQERVWLRSVQQGMLFVNYLTKEEVFNGERGFEEFS